jgi:hypothetical protein
LPLLISLFCWKTQRFYPEARVEVDVSSGKDDVPNIDVSANKKMSVGDDVEDGGASSAKLIAPNPISFDAPEQADPSIADWVALVVPPTGRRGRKHPLSAIRQNKPLPSGDQVMTQVELPPYHGPHSPLDLVVIEIIFARLFEIF